MATVSSAAVPLQRTVWLRPKYLLFGFIGLMFAYVLRHNESFLVNASNPEWAHIHPFRWYLLPHGLMGACALLLGPLQFSDRLRQRFTKMHRVIGRFYVAGVFVGAPMGLYIQYYEERLGGTRSFSLAAGTDAALWILTTAVALFFILKGKVQQHRQWMTRSYAVAIVFLEVRVVSGVLGFDESIAAGETIVWMCVAFSLLFADLVLQWQDFARARNVPARTQNASR
jgi:uncharacterized membrane protein